MESGVSTCKRPKRKQSSYCAAANCNNTRSKRPDLSFFKFPKDPDRMSSMFQTEITSEMSPSETFIKSMNGESKKISALPSGEKSYKMMEQQREEEHTEMTHFVVSSNSPVNHSLGYRSNEAQLLLNEDQMCAEIKEEELVEEDDDKTDSFVDSCSSPVNDSFETDQYDRVKSRTLTEHKRIKNCCNKVQTNVQTGSVWPSDVMNSIKIELASLSDMSDTDISNHGDKFNTDFDSFQCKEETNMDDEDRQEAFREATLSSTWRSFSDEIPVEVKKEPNEFRTPEEYWDQRLHERSIPDDDDNHGIKAEDIKDEITRDPPSVICRKPWRWPLSKLGVEYLDSSENDESSLEIKNKIFPQPKPTIRGKKHGKLKQKSRKQYICQICNKIYPKPSHLMRHLRVHTGEKPYKCELCPKAFRLSTGLRAHMRVHTGEKPFKCPVCSELFRQRSTLHHHLIGHSGVLHKCCVCEKTFGRRSHLKRHQLCHTGEKPQCCDICGKRFRDNDSLRKHAWSHDATIDRPFKCETCGKGFINNPCLTEHAKMHTGDRTFMCDICGARFGRRSHLLRHSRTHTGEKPHQCNTCGRCFTRSSHLARHRDRLCSHKKSFHCYVCLEKFSSSMEVKHHFSFALVELKHFKCRECAVEFATVLDLNRHMNAHRKVKVYQCEVCQKCYKNSSGLVLHQRSHTGEKPYVCEFCATSFSRSASYHKHRRIHLREQTT